MVINETLQSRAGWRETQVRGEVEGEARWREVRHAMAPRPHLPGSNDVMDLEEQQRAHRDPDRIGPFRNPPHD